MGLYLTGSDILRVNAAMESFGRLSEGGCSSESLAEATSAVAAALDASHSVAFVPTGNGVLTIESGTAPEVARAYAANFKGIREGCPEYDDPLLTSTTARRVQKRGGIFHERALAPRRTIDASPFYNEVLRPNGLAYVMGMGVPAAGGRGGAHGGFRAGRRSQLR